MIFAIDPGTTESAYVVLDDNLKPVEFDKIPNDELLLKLYREEFERQGYDFALEVIKSYGMEIGNTTIETAFWSGRFWEAARYFERKGKIPRLDERMNLCHSTKASDTNIRCALVDRFAFGEKNHGKGTKKAPGWFYGVGNDVWSAIAVGVTYHDKRLRGEAIEA